MIRFTVFDVPKDDAFGVYPRRAHKPTKPAKPTPEFVRGAALILKGLENTQLDFSNLKRIVKVPANQD